MKVFRIFTGPVVLAFAGLIVSGFSGAITDYGFDLTILRWFLIVAGIWLLINAGIFWPRHKAEGDQRDQHD